MRPAEEEIPKYHQVRHQPEGRARRAARRFIFPDTLIWAFWYRWRGSSGKRR